MFKSPHGAWEGTCTLCWAWPQQVRAARMVLYMTLASRLHPLSSSRGMQVSLLINCKNCDALTLILELMVVFIFLSPSLSAYLLSHNVLRSIMRPDFRYIAICAQVALRGEDIYGEPLNNTPPDFCCVFRWTVGFQKDGCSSLTWECGCIHQSVESNPERWWIIQYPRLLQVHSRYFAPANC